MSSEEAFTIYPIGMVRRTEDEVHIQILERFSPALKQLEHFSHVQVLWWAHKTDNEKARTTFTCVPPYGENPPETGVFATRAEWDLIDPRGPYYSFSDWYACFGGWWLLDEFLSQRPEVEAEPLPQERNGYRMVESGPTFSGGVIRQHDWMVAMSAILPVPGESVFTFDCPSYPT